MISGNIENILSPIRTISGKVEVIDTSTLAQSGTAVRLEGCTVGVPLEVSLASNTVTDFTSVSTRPSRNILNDKQEVGLVTFTVGTEVRNRYGFSIDNVEAGSYVAHAEIVKEITANISYYVVDDNNTSMGSANITLGGVPCGGGGKLTVEEGQHLLVILMGATYNLERAIEIFASIKLQIEKGNIPTPYEPYGIIEKPVELLQYGKNILNTKTHPFINNYWNKTTGKLVSSTNYSCNDILIPVEHLQGKTLTLNKPLSLITTGGSGGTVFFAENEVETFIEGSGTLYSTFTVPTNAKWMGVTIPRAYADGTEVQIEIGDKETEYEPYKEPKVYVPDASGNVAGVLAYAVNTLVTNNTEVTLTAAYSVDVEGDTYTNNDKLKSVQIDRTGSGKFFGYGISQKATVVLVDKDCTCGLAKDDKLTVSFDDQRVTPLFYINDTKRNEVSGELTVTAYDSLNAAAAHTVKEINLTSYTIGELVEAAAALLKVGISYPTDIDTFSLMYEGGANFDGTETIRAVLDAAAEVTQTVYYLNNENTLVFKRLDTDAATALEIPKAQYYNLENKGAVKLTGISSITELGNNIEATTAAGGITQSLYNNPLLEMREDTAELLNEAAAAVGGTTIAQYNAEWRGNYLLEPCDKITLTNKDNTVFDTFLINDTITYNGGYKQVSKWEYAAEEKPHTNPSNLGDAIKQTYAKVDKVNKSIEMVASEADANKKEIANLRLDTDKITLSVSDIERSVGESIDGINEGINELTTKVNATMTAEQIKFEISTELANGVEKVSTTTKGYTFDDNGLSISSSESDISTTITEDGMQIKDDGNEVLTASHEGVKAVDLHATTFLVIGDYSRLQNKPNETRTACFWIGG